jgi:integrase
MARIATALTDTKIKNAKAKAKDYKLFDGGGLYILVTKAGGKNWKLKYKFDSKEKLLSLGSYPKVSLAKARELREKYKTDISNGIDPGKKKKEIKQKVEQESEKQKNTFEVIALERLNKVKEDISDSHYKRTLGIFKKYTFKALGDIPIDKIEPKHIIGLLKEMMEEDIKTSTQKAHQAISKTFKYAVAHGYATRNPSNDFDIKEITGVVKTTHYPTITDEKGIKNLLMSIKEYGGELSTKYALLFLAYTFVRPTNARLALWSEIDLEAKQWVIPAKKMKTRDEFIIPLSNTLIELLQEIKLYSGDSEYLFPSTKSKSTPLSDGALIGAVRRMGYTKEEFTPHGFRAMFSTIAHEKSHFAYEVIETQLAHSVGNSVSQAYNRAKYLDERVKLMQWWSDYLDEVQR